MSISGALSYSTEEMLSSFFGLLQGFDLFIVFYFIVFCKLRGYLVNSLAFCGDSLILTLLTINICFVSSIQVW